VPGQAGVTFTQPGGYVLYIEEPGQCCSINVASDTSSAPFASWSMQVRLQPASGGPQVSIGTWQGITESYGITGHEGPAWPVPARRRERHSRLDHRRRRRPGHRPGHPHPVHPDRGRGIRCAGGAGDRGGHRLPPPGQPPEAWPGPDAPDG
jgi:hypothetical protein